MAWIPNPSRMNRGTGVTYAFDYLMGLAVFGFLFWLLNGILPAFNVFNLGDYVYNLAMFFWGASFMIYLIFTPFYFWNRLKEYNP